MVEENKGDGKKEEEKKQEEKKEDEIIEIVLKVDMHCEACARKVARSLKGFPGLEEVRTDYKTSKVVVKGKNADPLKVCERVQKKSGKKVELISPLPKPPKEKVEEKKEEPKQEKKDVKQPPPPPAVTTVVLNVHMHCDACAQGLQKRIRKIKGVECVTTDLGKSQVVVTGVFDDSEKLASEVFKKTKKQVSVVKNEEVKKEEAKKDEEKKDKQEEEEKKEGGGGDDDNKAETMKKMEYTPPPRYYYNMEYGYYAPQIFSDDNPNACSVM